MTFDQFMSRVDSVYENDPDLSFGKVLLDNLCRINPPMYQQVMILYENCESDIEEAELAMNYLKEYWVALEK